MARVAKPNEAAGAYPGMGTLISYTVYGGNAGRAVRAAKRETERLENLLSRFRPDSDIGRLNSSAGEKAVKVRGETFEVLTRAVLCAERSGGRFDPTVGPLAGLWKTSIRAGKTPDEGAVNAVMQLVGYRALRLDARRKTAGLERKGQSVDLGGIGKGYAADRIVRIFREYGIASAFINFGGNVAAAGARPDGSPWRIGIRHPRTADSLIGMVAVVDKSVVTSGDDQQYFTASDGRRYHHIVDPVTGRPSETGLVSVTIAADSSADADALSTAVYVSGLEQGLAILARYPGAQAVCVDNNLNVYVTKGLEGSFQAAGDIKINYI